jgi:hypothetical protein
MSTGAERRPPLKQNPNGGPNGLGEGGIAGIARGYAGHVKVANYPVTYVPGLLICAVNIFIVKSCISDFNPLKSAVL